MLGKLPAITGTSRAAKKSFLLRFYFGIILAIAALALVLDNLAYRYLSPQTSHQEHQVTFALAQDLAKTKLHNADFTSEVIGNYSLSFLPLDGVHLTRDALVTNDFRIMTFDAKDYLAWLSDDEQHLLRLGPLPSRTDPPDWPAWIFYSSLFVLVSLWLRPLLKDLDKLAQAVDAFKINYRAELPQLKQSSNLKPLADDIEAMATRIRQLIDTQKDLSRVLSHEMRTPLARIKFSLALLKDTGELSNSQQQELNGIDDDVVELEQLTQSMLNFAKLDHPDMAIDRQWQCAKSWFSEYQEKCLRYRASVSIEFFDDIPDNNRDFFIDAKWLDLAANNLISNSLRYATSKITVTMTVNGNRFSLTVADDGPGINEEEVNQVIKPFYQPAHEQRKSFGLGLALVKRIAELHNGGLQIGRAALGGAEVTSYGLSPKTQD